MGISGLDVETLTSSFDSWATSAWLSETILPLKCSLSLLLLSALKTSRYVPETFVRNLPMDMHSCLVTIFSYATWCVHNKEPPLGTNTNAVYVGTLDVQSHLLRRYLHPKKTYLQTWQNTLAGGIWMSWSWTSLLRLSKISSKSYRTRGGLSLGPLKVLPYEMFGGPFTSILRRHGKTTKTLAIPEN